MKVMFSVIDAKYPRHDVNIVNAYRLNEVFIRRTLFRQRPHIDAVVIHKDSLETDRCRLVKQVLWRQKDPDLTQEFSCYRSQRQGYFLRCPQQDAAGTTVVLRLIGIVRRRLARHDRSCRQRRLGVRDHTSSSERLKTDRLTE